MAVMKKEEDAASVRESNGEDVLNFAFLKGAVNVNGRHTLLVMLFYYYYYYFIDLLIVDR